MASFSENVRSNYEFITAGSITGSSGKRFIFDDVYNAWNKLPKEIKAVLPGEFFFLVISVNLIQIRNF